jgi:MFS transporter, DHA2 family, methylenomycin A resistance protein
MGGLPYGAIEAGAAGFAAARVATFAVAGPGAGRLRGGPGARGSPDVPLNLFRSRTVPVAVVVAVGFAFVVGYYGLPFVMSLSLQQLRGLSPLAIGAAFVPMMLVGAAVTPFSARLAEKLGARVLISADLVLMATGLLIFGVVASSARVWALAVLFNGRLMARSPLNDLEEPELLRLGVEGKRPAGVRCTLRRTPTALIWARPSR